MRPTSPLVLLLGFALAGCFPPPGANVATEARLANSPQGPVALGLEAQIFFLFNDLETPSEMELVLGPGLTQASAISGDSDWEVYDALGEDSNDAIGWGLTAEAAGTYSWALHLGGADAPADHSGEVAFEEATGWLVDTSTFRLDGGLEDLDALHFVADFFVAEGPDLQLVNAAGDPLEGEGPAAILERGTVFFDDLSEVHFENGAIGFISNEIPTTSGRGRIRLDTGLELATPLVTAHETDEVDSSWTLDLQLSADGRELWAHLAGPDGALAHAPGTAGPIDVREGEELVGLEAADAAGLPDDGGCGWTVALDPAGERWTFDFCIGDLCAPGEVQGTANVIECEDEDEDGLEGTCIDISNGSRLPAPGMLLLGALLSLAAVRRR